MIKLIHIVHMDTVENKKDLIDIQHYDNVITMLDEELVIEVDMHEFNENYLLYTTISNLRMYRWFKI